MSAEDADDMANPSPIEEQAEIEVAAADIGESLALLWREIYVRLMDKGFEEPQAMMLVVQYIHATKGNPGGDG